MAQPKKYIAVVAIDFGTTYSGFAFTFLKHSDGEDDIYMNKEWDNEQGSTHKTPTCILLDSDRQFHSFGYRAQEKYASLEDANEARKYLFFDRFKMELHNERNDIINQNLTLKARNGQSMDAVEIFALAIEHLKKKALEVIHDTAGFEITCDDIKWILTVPAIWRPAAKLFMREAAIRAKLLPKNREGQLIVALEPEAASLHCRQRKMRDFVDENGDECCADTIAMAETCYMVVDCGGGTVDVTVHRINADGTVEEIHKATGGEWGGTKVDKEFEKLLDNIFGIDFMDKFRKDHPSDWLELNLAFEMKKRSGRPLEEEENITRIQLPLNFLHLHGSHHKDKSLAVTISKKYTEDEVKISRGYLCLGPVIMKELFKGPVDAVISHMQSLLALPSTRDVNYVFLVGGFSESPILQKEVRKAFTGVRILIPRHASLSVVKGAVMFGVRPDIIRRRICAETYGCDINRVFDPKIHNDKYRYVTSDGNVMCSSLFSKLATVGEEIRLGDRKKFTFQPTEKNQSMGTFTFYTTSKEDAVYIDEPKVKPTGTYVDIASPDIMKGTDRKIELNIEFGDTEIKVEARDVESGTTKPARIKLATV